MTLALLETSTVKYHEGELTVRLALEVAGGEVVVKRGYPEKDVRLSAKRALKIARVLGCEAEVREAIEVQAREALAGAEKSRQEAADQYASRLKWAGEKDAAARRALEALDVA